MLTRRLWEGSKSSEEAGEAAGTETVGELLGEAQIETETPDEPVTVVTKVRATDVVNIRTSDSETADKLGKAAVGEEFTLLEERGNGWSKISYEGGEAYIKSEFLEPSETMQADAGGDTGDDAQQEDEEPEETPEPAQTDNSSDSSQVTGTVTVKENVRIRASASESSEKLGTAFIGEKLNVLMEQADGWTRIEYNGRSAYVKSDYVE